MTRDDTKALLARISATYPNFKPENRLAIVEAWTPILADDDPVMIGDALTMYVKTDRSGFPPTVGQLHGLISDAVNADDGAVMHMLKRASRNSNYGSEEEFEKMPEYLKQAVGSPGVIRSWGIQTEEQLEYTFGRILKAYKTITQRSAVSTNSMIQDKIQNLLEVKCETFRKHNFRERSGDRACRLHIIRKSVSGLVGCRSSQGIRRRTKRTIHGSCENNKGDEKQ